MIVFAWIGCVWLLFIGCLLLKECIFEIIHIIFFLMGIAFFSWSVYTVFGYYKL